MSQRTPNPAVEEHFRNAHLHTLQLGHLAADPLLSLWIDPTRLAEFLTAELAGKGAYEAQIAEAEAAWLRRVHAAPWPPDVSGL